ncbi:SPX3 protein, partial [Polyodon spathula]|nr:SPX3 protein [Polyodon spathula]
MGPRIISVKSCSCLSLPSSRGFIFGMWSACASVGNILGAFLASCVLKYGYECITDIKTWMSLNFLQLNSDKTEVLIVGSQYQTDIKNRFGGYAFLVTSSVQFAGGVVVFFGLLSSPEELDLSLIAMLKMPASISTCVTTYSCLQGPAEEESTSEQDEDSRRPLIGDGEEVNGGIDYSVQGEEPKKKPTPIGFFQAFCLPGVLSYSMAYACLKLVNYSFFFWLPFYLSVNYGWKETEADQLSIWYDVGGIIGGTVLGLISDVLQKRAPVLAVSLILAMGSLIGYSHSPNNQPVNAVLMAITGFFIGGPSNMISSAISADLGRQEELQGSQEALATVTGIVDGTGSVGAAAGQVLGGVCVCVCVCVCVWRGILYF